MSRERLTKKANEWAKYCNLTSKDQQDLVDFLSSAQTSEEDLKDSFEGELSFGTGGIRAPRGLGPNRMNRYTIQRATLALVKMLAKNRAPDSTGKLSVVIAYDSRIDSKLYAQEAARVIAGQNGTAYLFSRETPTPTLSFATRALSADGGIVITASHNPKIYNGFKAYWSDGHQLTPPYDRQTIELFRDVSDLRELDLPIFEESLKKKEIIYVSEEIEVDYLEAVLQSLTDRENTKISQSEIGVSYSPLHGTGTFFVSQVAEKMGLKKFSIVEAQKMPDGTFPTLEFPNPEDPEALKMCVELMQEKKYDIALASDPDTDRLGVVANCKSGLHYLSGNEIAVILLYHRLVNWDGRGLISKNALVLKSIVTTQLLDVLCEKFKVECFSTLTGFKWMGAEMLRRENEGRPFQFIFGTEESFGYLPHSAVRDKDGVSAFAMMVEAAADFKNQGMDLAEVLDKVRNEFGDFQERVLSFQFPGSSGMEKMKQMMEKLRSASLNEFSTDDFSFTERIDLNSKLDQEFHSKSFQLSGLPKSNVIGLATEDDQVLWCRPSGTEPKIKFYLMTHGKDAEFLRKMETSVASFVGDYQ